MWRRLCSVSGHNTRSLRLTKSSPEDLSEMLAAGTKEVHEKAENTQFVKDFLRGRIRRELFKVSPEKKNPRNVYHLNVLIST